MRLINVNSFLEREQVFRDGGVGNRRAKVFEWHDGHTEYAILSHRWLEQQGQTAEVSYDEMAELAKMEGSRDEIRQRDGYQKILHSCRQAKQDEIEWLWVDTCCIDTRSTAEISEAINSMFQWYENAAVCYAHLHDVLDVSFPYERNDVLYPNSNGWPEWFSRGWTLQELIAPRDVHFFNNGWQLIGDKRTLVHMLAAITRIPSYIIMDGMYDRPCVAQIMSWAADRTTTLVEDRAYSLLGLLDVNMTVSYGEGKAAFQRLQREIIRASNDQSIFAWDPKGSIRRAGSVLADDPSFFKDCSDMHMMEITEFISCFKDSSDIPAEELRTLEEEERLGSFPISISTQDIPIWIPLARCLDSRSVFQATLAVRTGPMYSGPVTIYLAVWNSKYYRYFAPPEQTFPAKLTPEFRKVSLSYQVIAHHDRQFDVDDKAISDLGFTYCGTFPNELTGKTLTLTSAKPLFVSVYTNSRANLRFVVGYGQCFGQDWVHVVSEVPSGNSTRLSWEDYAEEEYQRMSLRGPEHAQYIADAHSKASPSVFYTKHTRLPRSIWTVRTSFVRWENSDPCTVTIEGIRNPSFCYGPHRWKSFGVDGTQDQNRDIRGLMLCSPQSEGYELLIDGVPTRFSLAPDGITLGDYGHVTTAGDFQYEGNLFSDLKSLAPDLDIAPRQHKIHGISVFNADSDHVIAYPTGDSLQLLDLYKPLGVSIPNSHSFNLSLNFLAARLTNRYLITKVVQNSSGYSTESSSQKNESGPLTDSESSSPLDINNLAERRNIATPLYVIQKPLVWCQDALERLQFEEIKTHFCNLLHQSPCTATEDIVNNQRRGTDAAIKFFSELFALEHLKDYVGDISFFSVISSIASSGSGYSMSSAALCSCVDALEARLRKRIALDADVLTMWEVLPFEKRKIECDAELSSKCLGIMLLQDISAHYQSESHESQNPESLYSSIQSMVKEVKMLQGILDSTTTCPEEKWALEEDIIGKILWICWCGIHAEVGQVLPEALDHITSDETVASELRNVRPWYIGNIFEEAAANPPDDIQAHLLRVMADAEAGVSKHQLLLAEKAVQIGRPGYSNGAVNIP